MCIYSEIYGGGNICVILRDVVCVVSCFGDSCCYSNDKYRTVYFCVDVWNENEIGREGKRERDKERDYVQ